MPQATAAATTAPQGPMVHRRAVPATTTQPDTTAAATATVASVSPAAIAVTTSATTSTRNPSQTGIRGAGRTSRSSLTPEPYNSDTVATGTVVSPTLYRWAA